MYGFICRWSEVFGSKIVGGRLDWLSCQWKDPEKYCNAMFIVIIRTKRKINRKRITSSRASGGVIFASNRCQTRLVGWEVPAWSTVGFHVFHLALNHGWTLNTLPTFSFASQHPLFYVGIYPAIGLLQALCTVLSAVAQYLGALRASRV